MAATCTASQVIAMAKSQIGVKESPAGSNNVKYNTDYYGKAVSGPAYPWCVVFIWWVFQQVCKALFYNGGKTASCGALMRYAKDNKQWVTSKYQPGDIVLFSWTGNELSPDHAGIVERVGDGVLYTIEGNTSLTNNDNGGCVMQRVRDLNVVCGAYRPKYTIVSATIEGGTVTVTTKEISYGSTGTPVRSAQILLNGYGYNAGTVDGDFGNKTKAAVIAFQKAKSLTADGIVGTKTWNKLING